MAEHSHTRYTPYLPLFSVLAFGLRYVIPPAITTYLAVRRHEGSAISAGVAWALYLVFRLIALSAQWNARKKGDQPIRLLIDVYSRPVGLRRYIPHTARLVLVLIAICFSDPVRPQSNADIQECELVHNDPDRAIRQCTSIIDSGRYSGANLAVAYNNRGLAWMIKGDYDRDIADFDIAIRLWRESGIHLPIWNAQAAQTFTNRGLGWIHKGDYDHAVADDDVAIRLNPWNALAFTNRGLARFFQGQFGLASEDFVQALELKKQRDAYGVIWRYLARARNRENARSELAEDAKVLANDAWPAPAISLYLGQIGPEALIAAAANSDVKLEAEQRCEANYYLGQWHLLRGERDQAAARFHAAEGLCPKSFLEYLGALAELKRLR